MEVDEDDDVAVATSLAALIRMLLPSFEIDSLNYPDSVLL